MKMDTRKTPNNMLKDVINHCTEEIEQICTLKNMSFFEKGKMFAYRDTNKALTRIKYKER